MLQIHKTPYDTIFCILGYNMRRTVTCIITLKLSDKSSSGACFKRLQWTSISKNWKANFHCLQCAKMTLKIFIIFLRVVPETLNGPSTVMYEIEFWAQKIRDRNFFNLGKYFETNLCEFLTKVFLWMTTFFQCTHSISRLMWREGASS